MTENLLDGAPDSGDNSDPGSNYFEQLVGEGKKFKDPESLARGKFESDNYIRHKEQQYDELRADYLKLREEYNAGQRLQTLIDQLSTQQQQQLASSDNTQANGVQQAQIDPKQIESLVSSKIQEHEITKMQMENFNAVRNKLVEQYGENYQNVLKKQVSDLGLTEAEVNEMAKRHPKVLMRTLGLDQPAQRQDFQTPTRSSQSSFTPTGAPKRTWSYYQKMKKENPKQYTDPKTQVQMHKDAIAMGEAFQDGDWATGNY